MIKPDVITIWPRAYDYPIWRKQIEDNRRYFDKVIVVFTHNDLSRDFRPFLMENHPTFTYLDSEDVPYNRGWYNTAFNLALDNSKNKWVLLLEQDFLYGDNFMPTLLNGVELFNFVGFRRGQRYDPACFLIQRNLIERSHRYFEPIRNDDCFDFFTKEQEIMAQDNSLLLEQLGLREGIDYEHLTGLTHNYRLCTTNQAELLAGKEKFFKYNRDSEEIGVVQSPEWLKVIDLVKTYEA